MDPDYFSTYSNNSKNICVCTAISIIIIFLFVISPLKQHLFVSMSGKIVALLILAYVLVKNYMNTNYFSQSTNSNLLKGEWNSIKTNILCSYVFSFFILLLIFTLIKHMFL